jgi:Domain of Unknown Function with PDB structure (DUF3857)
MPGFTLDRGVTYTSLVSIARQFIPSAILCCSLIATCGTLAQEPASKPPQASSPSPLEKEKPLRPELPFQIQLLETKIRFEVNGDSRKEVHTVVKIMNILGAHQFARISFDYNRSFQQVEIPQVRVIHGNGGTSEVLPSAITDAPNSAVEQFPAYRDVRVKSVRILGLQEGDTVEYRVITTTVNPPLAPNFWLEHTFDRSGQVLEEHYELDIPEARSPDVRIAPSSPPSSKESSGEAEAARTVYRWTRKYEPLKDSEKVEIFRGEAPDVAASTLKWGYLAARLAELMFPGSRSITDPAHPVDPAKELNRQPAVSERVREKANLLTAQAKTDLERFQAIYDFVSTKVATVDLPLDATGFHSRESEQVLNSAYATAQDKHVLFAALAAAAHLHVEPALTGFCDKSALPMPNVFKHLVVIASTKDRQYWLDPGLEVAPFGMISPTPAKCALLLDRAFYETNSDGQEWVNVPAQLPFAAFQKVSVDAVISDAGQLSAKVRYVLRGENELLLRVAFHQTPREKWKDVANLLAISDGFRGQVTTAEASDPTETAAPFTVEYELTQLKFVDWSKKPARIPALLPQISLPDMSLASASGQSASAIELGTPLEVQTSMTLHLPAGTTAETPPGTTVTRDYATFTSKYSSAQNTVTASRHIAFLHRSLPADRVADYAAFLHAVQNDQAQHFTLVNTANTKQ